MKYSDKLKDPRWQRKRLEILQRDGWSCQICGDIESTLHVHHRRYLSGKDPWDYDDRLLITLCANCHENESDARNGVEHELILILREKFCADEVYILAQGFLNLDLQHISGVVASAIKMALSSSEIQNDLIDRYLASIKNK